MSFDSPLGLRHPTVKSLPILYWKKYWDLEKILIFFTINTDKNTDSSREFWLLFWWFYYVEIVSSDIPQSNLSQDWKKYWKLGKIFFPGLILHLHSWCIPTARGEACRAVPFLIVVGGTEIFLTPHPHIFLKVLADELYPTPTFFKEKNLRVGVFWIPHPNIFY